MDVYEQMKALGIALPSIPKSIASYEPALVCGGWYMPPGKQPWWRENCATPESWVQRFPSRRGRLRAPFSANCLAAIEAAVGSLDKVERMVRLTGYVASAQGFVQQPQVIEGASALLLQLFGQQGRHARSAIGVAELPFGASVEVELIARLKEA